MNDKSNSGNYFEDFHLGQKFVHATPRTVTEGDVALHSALNGSRFAFNSADTFAMNLGLDGAPLDDFLVFHIILGRCAPDISINAIQNIGYASGRFGSPVFPGDTLKATSSVIGLKPNSNGESGIIWVHSEGTNQNDERVVDFVHWIMVAIGDKNAELSGFLTPELDPLSGTKELSVPKDIDLSAYNAELSGSNHLWGDYETGERIDHIDSHTVEASEHQLAARLYQNNVPTNLNDVAAKQGQRKQRPVCESHVISIARALSFNGLANAFKIAALNGCTYAAPVYAGDTIYAWSEILGKDAVPERADLGALRIRTVACKNQGAKGFPYRSGEDEYDHTIVLDIDYTVLMPI